MYFVYILQSIKFGIYYVGHTKDINIRLKQHNSGKVCSTKKGIPWKLIYKEEYQTKQDAYRRELQVKSYKGGNAFKFLIQNK